MGSDGDGRALAPGGALFNSHSRVGSGTLFKSVNLFK